MGSAALHDQSIEVYDMFGLPYLMMEAICMVLRRLLVVMKSVRRQIAMLVTGRHCGWFYWSLFGVECWCRCRRNSNCRRTHEYCILMRQIS